MKNPFIIYTEFGRWNAAIIVTSTIVAETLFFFEIVVAETSIHKTRVVHGTHFSIVEQTEESVGFGYGRMEDVPRSQIIAL